MNINMYLFVCMVAVNVCVVFVSAQESMIVGLLSVTRNCAWKIYTAIYACCAIWLNVLIMV